MKNRFLILITVLITTTVSFGQNPLKKVDLILDSIHEKHPEIAISVGLIHTGKEYHRSLGNLNRESSLNVDKNSIFEITSITKAITGNLIAQAVHDGKINLNDYIEKHLPDDFSIKDEIKNKITIADLVSHQSGLPDINFPELIAKNPQQPVSSVTLKTISSLINNCSELTDYGIYRYSTVGFILLGQILEHVYQENYETILNKEIIEPLQLQRTFTDNFNVENITTGYNPEGGKQELFLWNVTAPAGLIKSSSSDILSYLQAVLSDKSSISKASLISEKTFYKDDRIEIGLGMNIIRDNDQIIYAKTGDSMGQSSVMAYNRNAKWGIIIMMNERNSKLRNELFNSLYEVLN